MKILSTLVFALPFMLLLAGCQDDRPSQQDEMLALFEQYWYMGEDAETGGEILRRFKEDPAPVLEAMIVTTHFEHILILFGDTIARARRDDPAAYAEYARALELAAGSELGEDSARILRFLHANIEHWYNY